MVTYEQIKKANESIRTTVIQQKDYAEVNQRIKAFRMVYPDGFIDTRMQSNIDGVCVFRAEVGFYAENGNRILIGSGTAYEKENSSFINKTSYIENCETSAVGRALGMAGFGIDTSVASAEEVQNAMRNQAPERKEPEKKERKATSTQVEILKQVYTGANLKKLLETQGVERIEDISLQTASAIIQKLKEMKGERK